MRGNKQGRVTAATLSMHYGPEEGVHPEEKEEERLVLGRR